VKGPPLADGHHRGGRDCGADPRQPHAGGELAAVQVQVPEDDQVGQVRAGQQQRAGVGQQQAPVQQRGLALAAAARGVHQDRRQERH
jgi:hypothetical protein